MKRCMIGAMFFAGLAAAVQLAAQSAIPAVVVSAFTARGQAVTAGDAEGITELFMAELAKTGKLRVIDRNNLDKVIREMKFQTSDWSDKEKTAQLGAALNAGYLVNGSISQFGGTVSVTITTLEIKTLEVASAATERFEAADLFLTTSEKSLFAKMPAMAKNVATPITDLFAKAEAEQKKRDDEAAIQERRAKGIYLVGEKGPAGGTVFYDKGARSNGWRYLEFAPDIMKAPWGNYKVDGTSPAIGAGKENTRLIIAVMKQKNVANTAAQLCAAMDYGGYKDWFLPSRDELMQIPGANRPGSVYWTSTEVDKNFARSDGNNSAGKNGSLRFLAIRAF